jgi:hypothetical protein
MMHNLVLQFHVRDMHVLGSAPAAVLSGGAYRARPEKES